jgi:hypothetical protein
MATIAAQPPSGEQARSRAQIDQFCAPSAEIPAESIFLLCYLRGPAGLIVALAELIG